MAAAESPQSNELPELGVGVIYSSDLEDLLSENPGLIDVVEIEPQTTWVENPVTGHIQARSDVDEHIAGLPARKLIHSVGTPVGGSVDTLQHQLPLLRQAVRKLSAPYASEHLAFNMTADFFTGFFLPPRQTASGINVYKQAISRLHDGLGVPIAIETGVNYLQPRNDEMPDSEFLGELVSSSGCGILLDLHNLYCNQHNGRQSIESFLSQIPLEHVWEVHLAGGFELDGFWLDAHSGAIPPPLIDICREVIPQLTNLKAIIFEIFSSSLPKFGLNAVQHELEKLRVLWELRGRATSRITKRVDTFAVVDSDPQVEIWERSLGRMVLGDSAVTPLEHSIAQDPGVRLIQELVHEFRASMVVSVYRLTSRLLMLTLTPAVFRQLLEAYWSRVPPRQYAASEADGFFNFLRSKKLPVPWFEKILEFERSAICTLCDSRPRIVRFSADPLPLLRSLAEARLPDVKPQDGDFEIELRPDAPISVSQTLPFH